jgi:N-acetylneuraminic acid mutarotase
MRHRKVIDGNSFLLIALIFFTCSDELATRSYPSIDTQAVTEISENGATLNARIISTGDAGISDHGFVYDDIQNPTLESSDRISLGSTSRTGKYSALASNHLITGKTYYVKAYARSKETNFVVYGERVEFKSMGGVAPVITDFLPKEGVIGDTLLLIATGMSTVGENNKVRFNQVGASTIKVSSDSLWCRIPNETPVGENTVTLSVGESSVDASAKFLLKPASITSVTPESVSFGDTVTITGLNFPEQPGLVRATLFGKDAIIASVSSTAVKIVVVDDVTTAESVVILKLGIQTLSSDHKIRLTPPTLNTIDPLKGTRDTEILITGNYFSPSMANNKVEINGRTLSLVEVTKSFIKAKIPAGMPPGVYPLSVTVAGQTATASSQFEIIKPLITNISPLTGTWGTTVTISGENFGTGITSNIVRFEGSQATIVSASPTEIKVQVPNSLQVKSASISVQAISTDNLKTTFESPFTLDAPLITSFTPDKGKSNSQVTIHGANFSPGAANHSVTFGDRQVQVVSATSNTLVVKLPTSLIDSDVSIHVTVAEQTATSGQTFHLESPWKKLGDYPGTGRSSASAFVVGGYGYITLGTTPTFSEKSTWRYDPLTDGWLKVKPFSFIGSGTASAYINTVAFSIDGYGYVGLGNVGGVPYGEISRYSPADDAWTQSAPIGDKYAAGLESAVAYSINGKGYVTSGRNAQNRADAGMKEYNPVTNSWQARATFPGTPRTEATGFSIGDNAFLTTGGSYNDLWKFNTTTNTWTELASLPGSERFSANAFAISDQGYLIAGSQNSNFFKDIWRYDPTTNTWTRLEDFPGEARASAVAFVIGTKAYFGTGVGSSGELIDFWEFDPSKL